MKTLLYWNERREMENSIKGGASMVEANVVRDFHIGLPRHLFPPPYAVKLLQVETRGLTLNATPFGCPLSCLSHFGSF